MKHQIGCFFSRYKDNTWILIRYNNRMYRNTSDRHCPVLPYIFDAVELRQRNNTLRTLSACYLCQPVPNTVDQFDNIPKNRRIRELVNQEIGDWGADQRIITPTNQRIQESHNQRIAEPNHYYFHDYSIPTDVFHVFRFNSGSCWNCRAASKGDDENWTELARTGTHLSPATEERSFHRVRRDGETVFRLHDHAKLISASSQ